MECEVVGQHYKLCTFIPDIGTYLPRMTLPKTGWYRLNSLRHAPAYTNGYDPFSGM